MREKDELPWSRDDVREVDVVTGCLMLVRRTAIEEVGLMDEQYYIYVEEADWCYRFHQAGWKNLFTPDAVIIHIGGVSSSQARPDMLLQLRGSGLLYYQKHGGFGIYMLACLIYAVYFAVRIPYWLGKAFISRKSRKRHLERAKTYFLGSVYALAGGNRLRLRR